MTAVSQASWREAVWDAAYAARRLYAAGAQRVWLCGSLAHGKHWDTLSDVDYATIGFPPSSKGMLITELEQALGRHVDIITLEDAASWLRTQITLEMVAVSPDGRAARTLDRPPAIPIVHLTGPTYPRGLHQQRHAMVTDALRHADSRKILDVGCAEGEFELALLKRWLDSDVTVRGIDPDESAIVAARGLRETDMADDRRRQVDFEVAGIADIVDVWEGHDTIVAIEVIEHLDAATLDAFGDLVFSVVRPQTVVLTTPNAEYNVLFPQAPHTGGRSFRHPDHQFEWTREQMRKWLRLRAPGYRGSLRGVGEPHSEYGSPTQMWVLRREPRAPIR